LCNLAKLKCRIDKEAQVFGHIRKQMGFLLLLAVHLDHAEKERDHSN